MNKIVFLLLLTSISIPLLANETPEVFLNSCFKDYVAAFALPGKESLPASTAVRKRCLSEKFNAEWDKMVSTEGTGADAFLLAQDYQESWIKQQKVRNLKSSSAEIVLGEKKELHCLKVLFVTEKGSLKINKVTNC